MSPALARRVALAAGVGLIIGTAIFGTILQRRSLADYASARHAVSGDIERYEGVLTRGESRTAAVASLRTAGAQVESAHGDIVITVLRELQSSAQCRSLEALLHVAIDAHDRVTDWESPPPHAECD